MLVQDADVLAPLQVRSHFGTILADPPWRFINRTGKVAPEHQRLLRYPTMALEEIAQLPISEVAISRSHLYLWVPNALLAEGLEVMKRWGFTYKTVICQSLCPNPALYGSMTSRTVYGSKLQSSSLACEGT